VIVKKRLNIPFAVSKKIPKNECRRRTPCRMKTSTIMSPPSLTSHYHKRTMHYRASFDKFCLSLCFLHEYFVCVNEFAFLFFYKAIDKKNCEYQINKSWYIRDKLCIYKDTFGPFQLNIDCEYITLLILWIKNTKSSAAVDWSGWSRPGYWNVDVQKRNCAFSIVAFIIAVWSGNG